MGCRHRRPACRGWLGCGGPSCASTDSRSRSACWTAAGLGEEGDARRQDLLRGLLLLLRLLVLTLMICKIKNCSAISANDIIISLLHIPRACSSSLCLLAPLLCGTSKQNHNDGTTHWDPPGATKSTYAPPPPPNQAHVRAMPSLSCVCVFVCVSVCACVCICVCFYCMYLITYHLHEHAHLLLCTLAATA